MANAQKEIKTSGTVLERKGKFSSTSALAIIEPIIMQEVRTGAPLFVSQLVNCNRSNSPKVRFEKQNVGRNPTLNQQRSFP
jgi:hypothetical protein